MQKEKTIYLATYTFCLIFVPIILNGIIYHRITILTEWWFYLPMFLIGVAGCFFPKGNPAFHTPFSNAQYHPWLFMGTLFRIFSDDSYYIVLTSMIYGLFLILWQTFQPFILHLAESRHSLSWHPVPFRYPSIWWGDNWDTFIFLYIREFLHLHSIYVDFCLPFSIKSTTGFSKASFFARFVFTLLWRIFHPGRLSIMPIWNS